MVTSLARVALKQMPCLGCSCCGKRGRDDDDDDDDRLEGGKGGIGIFFRIFLAGCVLLLGVFFRVALVMLIEIAEY